MYRWELPLVLALFALLGNVITFSVTQNYLKFNVISVISVTVHKGRNRESIHDLILHLVARMAMSPNIKQNMNAMLEKWMSI